jgi:hypothetical protein
MSPQDIEDMIKKQLMEAVKKLVEDKLPKQVPKAVVDEGVKFLEDELKDVHIFKQP